MSTDRDFKDHFSGHAGKYASSRPHYPPELFDWLVSVARGRSLAWDVATGSGQAACALAGIFKKVVATDASRQQIRHARAHVGVEYRIESAESSSLEDGSVDLATVGQALHWLDHERFFTECHRVLKPGGVLAAWAYQLTRVSEPVDEIMSHLNTGVLSVDWPPERRLVDRAYRGLAFPFTEIEPPEIRMQARWTLQSFCNYFRTWSAVQRYIAREGSDPLALIANDLEDAWGAPDRVRTIHWPIVIQAGFFRP